MTSAERVDTFPGMKNKAQPMTLEQFDNQTPRELAAYYPELRATVEALEAAQRECNDPRHYDPTDEIRRVAAEVAKQVREEMAKVARGYIGCDVIAEDIMRRDLAPIIEKALAGALGGGR